MGSGVRALSSLTGGDMSKKMFSILIGLILVAGTTIPGPARANKKPRVRAQPGLTFYLRNETEGCADSAWQLRLKAGDGPDCGRLTSGLANELHASATGDRCDLDLGLFSPTCWLTYVAVEGVPFVLDAKRDVTGMIAVKTFCCGDFLPVGSGAGPATLVISLAGHTGRDPKPKVIGQTEVEYTELPNQSVYELEFSLEPDRDLNKARFDTLAIDLWNRGISPMTGFYSTGDPSSFFTIRTKKG